MDNSKSRYSIDLRMTFRPRRVSGPATKYIRGIARLDSAADHVYSLRFISYRMYNLHTKSQSHE